MRGVARDRRWAQCADRGDWGGLVGGAEPPADPGAAERRGTGGGVPAGGGGAGAGAERVWDSVRDGGLSGIAAGVWAAGWGGGRITTWGALRARAGGAGERGARDGGEAAD